ncbi:Cell wall glucanase (Scw4) [Penicillium herquei]|nr:Cell wall glucanase (Scw4) [Penicillium herquei]
MPQKTLPECVKADTNTLQSFETLPIPQSTSTTTSDATHTLLTQTKPQDESTSTNDAASPKRLQDKTSTDEAHNQNTDSKHPSTHKDHRQFGISYSPYAADRSCKNQDQINKDLDALSTHNFIRIYGTDCDQTRLVATAARQHKMQVFAGIYDLTNFPQSLDAFKEAATDDSGKTDWSIYHTIAIGNELVNGGHNAPGEVTGAVTQARSYLRAQGYEGPVVTVDTFSVLIEHPELCRVSDYCAANCHAFFDATQSPHNAGAYAMEQMHSVSAAAGGKRTMITESGWPHAGQANGAAIPSPDNQRVAVESLRKSFAHQADDLVLFTAFDDLWKDDNRYTFNAERFWGIYDR